MQHFDFGPCLPSLLRKPMTYSLTGNRENIEDGHTLNSSGACFGSVSTGLIHATPGEIKSFRSSVDKIADILLPLEQAKR